MRWILAGLLTAVAVTGCGTPGPVCVDQLTADEAQLQDIVHARRGTLGKARSGDGTVLYYATDNDLGFTYPKDDGDLRTVDRIAKLPEALRPVAEKAVECAD